MQAILECKQCGGQLNPEEGQKIVYCKFCGSANAISIADRFGLYNRANYLRRQNEFDRAIGLYEDIIKEDPTDAEAYFGLALCKYGIEYVDDESGKKIPTCHRTRVSLISQDEDFKKAIEYADSDTLSVYMNEATRIDTILKKIQQLSAKQEKYDIFICYKEGDGNGGRTQTSVLAQDIYEHLTNKGYKVFFARKTLESKLGMDYEPIIFSALFSAKVMLVVGTSPEEFQAVWVRNEWVRYLERITKGEDCTLIPLYQDISPYDLPVELANIQALDMGKIGFMQDLSDGICKIIKKNTENIAGGYEVSGSNNSSGNISGLKRRAFIFLEQGDFESAMNYFERVLDNNPEDSDCYFGKLLVEFKCHCEADIENVDTPISEMQNYILAMKYGNEEQRKKYRRYSDFIDTKLYEQQKKREEEERLRAEQERIKAEERKRLEEERKRKEDEERKERQLRNERIFEKLLKLFSKGFAFFVTYIFILQFLIMEIGNFYLKLAGNYKGAYNFGVFMQNIPVANKIQDLPVFEKITELCLTEPDYNKRIEKWQSDVGDNFVALYGRFYSYHVGISDGKIVFEMTRDTEYTIQGYEYAKRLHDIRNDENKIDNIYSCGYNLFLLYNDGTVEHIFIDYDDDGYLKEGCGDEDYSEVEKWKDIVDLKYVPGFIYGLKQDGSIVRIKLTDEEWGHLNESNNWDEIGDLTHSYK